MAYQHTDWVTIADRAQRLERLNQHIQEVSAKQTQDVSSGGKSLSAGNTTQYLQMLMDERRSLMTALGMGDNPPSIARMRYRP